MSCVRCGRECFGNICTYCKGEQAPPPGGPVKSKWVLDSKDPDRVYIKLTEYHELCINFTGEGIILDNVDQRTGDVVDTRCLDLEDLNCCMDPLEAGEDEEFPAEDWRYEVANEDTTLGYQDWVKSKREAKEEDECPNCKNGTLERNESGELVCRGECGAIIERKKEAEGDG